MPAKDLLKGKRILLVDDEPDILDTLEDLLPMCEVAKASTHPAAKELLETQSFDMAILDIMGVAGYDLLEIANHKKVTAVMLTAHALTPENIVKSYKGGAASYLTKEEMVNITTFLRDILEAQAKGQNPWERWLNRMGAFCEKTFGARWQEKDKDFWEKFPFY
ncbi:MAG: response regulator [Desulfobacterales bacterium]|nr:MAG: response regulator [Desulfobacterales bacterium]